MSHPAVAKRRWEGERRQESVQATDGGFQTRHQAPAQTGSEEGGCEVLPATQRTRNDRALPKGEVGMGEHGDKLVVQ